MKYQNAGPRMAFTPDGKILFFDEKNEPIEIKKKAELTQEEFIELLNNNKLQHAEMISVFSFGPSSDCKIVYWYDNVRICFWVDCETGTYRRPCRSGE